MLPETQEYCNIATWIKDKIDYHEKSMNPIIKHQHVVHGEIWYCDLGYNIGTEKNKKRPVLIISNNRINRSEKVVVVSITDAKGKVNQNNLPKQSSWLLLYSSTTDDTKMIYPGRLVPANMHQYSFLEKDSMLQCEEIKAVSKARLDNSRGCIGKLEPDDFALFKHKFKNCYNL